MSSAAQTPTKQELKKLSLRGIVAYSARIALRNQPALQDEVNISQDQIDATRKAIDLMEAYVAGVRENSGLAGEFCVLARAASGLPGSIPSKTMSRAAACVSLAANSAENALDAAGAPDNNLARRCADNAAGFAQECAELGASASACDATVFQIACRRDYEKLLGMTTIASPAPGTPFQLGCLDPLWVENELCGNDS